MENAVISAQSGGRPCRQNQMRGGMHRQRELGQALDDGGPAAVGGQFRGFLQGLELLGVHLPLFLAGLAFGLFTALLEVPAHMVRLEHRRVDGREAVFPPGLAAGLFPAAFFLAARCSLRAVRTDTSSMSSITLGLTKCLCARQSV